MNDSRSGGFNRNDRPFGSGDGSCEEVFVVFVDPNPDA
jgi:hypothetical protein